MQTGYSTGSLAEVLTRPGAFARVRPAAPAGDSRFATRTSASSDGLSSIGKWPPSNLIGSMPKTIPGGPCARLGCEKLVFGSRRLRRRALSGASSGYGPGSRRGAIRSAAHFANAGSSRRYMPSRRPRVPPATAELVGLHCIPRPLRGARWANPDEGGDGRAGAEVDGGFTGRRKATNGMITAPPECPTRTGRLLPRAPPLTTPCTSPGRVGSSTAGQGNTSMASPRELSYERVPAPTAMPSTMDQGEGCQVRFIASSLALP